MKIIYPLIQHIKAACNEMCNSDSFLNKQGKEEIICFIIKRMEIDFWILIYFFSKYSSA